ncbi:MAG TPA: HAD family phosphatase [Polyangiaceae bacterium]|nr:HAD family phosphatase [Polyangiaceae bacterium]
MAHRAVFFDLGGVVFDSPLAYITEFEAEHGLPPHFVARIVGGYGGPDGPWQKLERGDITLEDFCERFDRDALAQEHALRTAELMRGMHGRFRPRPVMVAAIRKLREAGLRVAALTNNWVVGETYDAEMQPLRDEFHAFVESCKVRMRKPDPRIFVHACEVLGVAPTESVFLDDIGENLKSARKLGMTTIKVSEPEAALRELGAALGLALP